MAPISLVPVRTVAVLLKQAQGNELVLCPAGQALL